MPALKPTDYYADVVWLGAVTTPDAAITSVPLDELDLTFAGPQGDTHAGLTRPSCSRVTSQYPRGTDIRNTRQISILCADELDRIAAAIGLGKIDPSWLGSTMVVRGIPDFSHVPPSARLQSQSGTTVTIDMQNRPCHLPARVISAIDPRAGKGFKSAAAGLRGVTAWVERPGRLRLGDRLRLHIPDQREWSPNS